MFVLLLSHSIFPPILRHAGAVLDNNATFLGDSTVCDNRYLARDQVFQDADDATGGSSSSTSWWQVWVSSGIAATYLVKMTLANVGLTILHRADPLDVCGGRFEGPPGSFQLFGSDTELRALKHMKEGYLKMWATARLFFGAC
mmetsp:Transcript_21912/g.36212  ORF Transcript_21912/g.36212 Transcript_21912/m.36212 type:complete len:143 (+) Transcript_21912:1732-2160(+)